MRYISGSLEIVVSKLGLYKGKLSYQDGTMSSIYEAL